MKVFVSFIVLLVISCVKVMIVSTWQCEYLSDKHFFQAQEPDTITKVKEHVEVCRKEVGIEEDVALKISAGDFTLKDEKSQVRVVGNFKDLVYKWVPFP